MLLNHFDGKFYLITSPATYSSAHMTALAVKCYQIGTILGEPTGERINLTGESIGFELPNTKIYSAQTFEGAEEFTKLANKYDITDLSKDFKDFSYTAGALENVDLVISSDSSLAHLAGAMGKPCIILLPYNYNWRWHMDLSHCDWYDSVKLFRLGEKENWNELMKRIAKTISTK